MLWNLKIQKRYMSEVCSKVLNKTEELQQKIQKFHDFIENSVNELKEPEAKEGTDAEEAEETEETTVEGTLGEELNESNS